MISYLLRKSQRAKNLRITITRDGSVVVTLPYEMDEKNAGQFVLEKEDWIEKGVTKMKKAQPHERRMLPKGTKKEFEEYKEKAFHFVSERLLHFNKRYGYTWKRVGIKNISTRWGSCSKDGNLNFSYKIALLPPHLADYIIVHELCHLGAFNHSEHFWNLVGKTILDYKIMRKELRGVI